MTYIIFVLFLHSLLVYMEFISAVGSKVPIGDAVSKCFFLYGVHVTICGEICHIKVSQHHVQDAGTCADAQMLQVRDCVLSFIKTEILSIGQPVCPLSGLTEKKTGVTAVRPNNMDKIAFTGVIGLLMRIHMRLQEYVSADLMGLSLPDSKDLQNKTRKVIYEHIQLGHNLAIDVILQSLFKITLLLF
ncbi:hypothetical protein ACJX0J_011799 [Zea mays]